MRVGKAEEESEWAQIPPPKALDPGRAEGEPAAGRHGSLGSRDGGGLDQGRFRFELGRAVGGFELGDLDTEGGARGNEPAVLETADRAQDEGRVGRAGGVEERPARLHHGFEHHDTRQHGVPGEVVLEVLLRGRDVLDGHDAVFGAFKDRIEEGEVHGRRVGDARIVAEERVRSAVPAAQDDAICIRHWDWSETSQTVSLFTREHGVVRGLAKGSKRENAKFSGGIELLTRGQILFIAKPTTELATLTEWDLQELFPALRTSLKRFYAGMYVADLLQHAIRDHDPHPGAFDAAVACLRTLGESSGMVDEALARIQWALLTEMGYRPELSIDPRTGAAIAPADRYAFAPRIGGLINAGPDDAETWAVRGETVACLRAIASGGPAPTEAETWDRASRLLAAHLREVLGQALPSLPRVYAPGTLPKPARSS